MTTPGRAVMMVTRQRLVARSIKTFGTEAPSSFLRRKSRILRSSVRSAPKSFLLAYHFERQSLLTPTRKPIGLTFCPIPVNYSSETVILMWQRRLRIGPAEPRAFGVKRLSVVAVPATASFTRNDSGLSLLLFSALAMADFKVFATSRAPLRGTNCSTAIASSAPRPCTCRTTSRIFCADIGTFFIIAKASIKLFGLRLGRMRAVFLECARQRKFAELVADHVFRHEHRVENFSVMHGERQADKFRRNRRAARPRLDRRLLVRGLRLHDFVEQAEIHERTFFYRTSHKLFIFHRQTVALDNDETV